MKITLEEVDKYPYEFVIYRIYNKLNNKSYIGKSSKGLTRVYAHFRDHKNPKKIKTTRLLYTAMSKYGEDNFEWEIVFVCSTIEELNAKEIEFIKKYESFGKRKGYNLTEGGTGGNTWASLSEEEKIRASIKLSKALKKNYKNNPERRKGCSKILKEIRSNPKKSAKNAEIASKRLTILNKTDPRFIASRSTKIICQQNGKIYNSIREASLEFNINESTIANALRNKKVCKGYIFAYLEEYEKNGFDIVKRKFGNTKLFCIQNSKTYFSIASAAKDLGLKYSTLLTRLINNEECDGYTFKKLC